MNDGWWLLALVFAGIWVGLWISEPKKGDKQ